MAAYKVSVIVPVAHDADTLPVTMQSLLGQTHTEFEILVVDRTASSAVAEQLCHFRDPRIKYIYEAKGDDSGTIIAPGVQAATGEALTFLAPGDTFHPDKLRLHVAFLQEHREIGATYNLRLERDVAGMHLALWQPNLKISLADLVLGLPLAVYDLMIRKAWTAPLVATNNKATGYAEEGHPNARGGIPYQLALAGCRFAGLPSALTHCHSWPGTAPHHVEKAATAAIQRLEAIFSDQRCPPAVKALHHQAFGRAYLLWSYRAFLHNETALGQALLRTSIQFDRTILDVEGRAYLEFLARSCTRDAVDPEALLRRLFAQLPPALAWLTRFSEKAVAHGRLHQGVRTTLWGDLEQGRTHLSRAAALGAQVDNAFLYDLLDQLRAYEAAFGPQAAESALERLTRCLVQVGDPKVVRQLRSRYFADRALRHYHQQQHRGVPFDTLKAISVNPRYVANRGIWSILLRSLAYSWQQHPG